MLELTLPEREWFDDNTEEFVTEPSMNVVLEHSLYAISLWESKWKKPFLYLLSTNGVPPEGFLDYMALMIVEPKSACGSLSVITRLTSKQIEEVFAYIGDSPTATTINDREKQSRSNRYITSELIYAWMAMSGLEKSYEMWNVTRLLTLINVISIESNPNKKKMPKREVANMYHDINERNKKKLHTNG